MKRMKKYGLCWILAATMIASFVVTGCDMKLDDEDNRANVSSGSSSDNTTGGGTDNTATNATTQTSRKGIVGSRGNH